MDYLFSTNIAHAATVDSVVANANTYIVNPLIALLFALALGYFLYGVVEFIANQDNESKKTEGKQHILWGLIGITIMFGVWGLLQIVLDSLGVTGVDLEQGTVELEEYNPSYNLNLGGGSGGSGSGGGNGITGDPYVPPNNPYSPPANDPYIPPASGGGTQDPTS